ncbi:MAG: hypothetical protein KKD31_03535 [Bacteroidetes bacterium]|nr:hypothetical protein [Bacteroidota bacterium]
MKMYFQIMFISVISVILISGIMSCRKDGKYSSRNERLIVDKRWYLDQYLINGEDKTQYYKDSCDCNFTFSSNYWNRKAALCDCNWYHLGWVLFAGEGHYDLSCDNKYFNFGFAFPLKSFDIPFAYYYYYSWEVTFISRKQFHVRATMNGKTYEMHLSTNKQ